MEKSLKNVDYKELTGIVEGKVRHISAPGCLKLGLGLRIEIENKDPNSPIKFLRYDNLQANPPLRCGDDIKAHYLKAKEIVEKRKCPGIISSYFIRREPKEEEFVEKIEILIEHGIAVYGSVNERKVELLEKD